MRIMKEFVKNCYQYNDRGLRLNLNVKILCLKILIERIDYDDRGIKIELTTPFIY